MSGKETRSGLRKDHMQRPRHRDAYVSDRKGGGTAVCDGCGAVWHAGRWFWGVPPSTEFDGGLCPACERIRDRRPAGTIRVPAGFVEAREEVLGLIRNAEQAEKSEHPLERLMAIEDDPGGGLNVTTTGIHLARSIANKLERRFHRPARVQYPEAQNLMYVEWEA